MSINIVIEEKVEDTYETQSMNLNATNKFGDYDTSYVFLYAGVPFWEYVMLNGSLEMTLYKFKINIVRAANIITNDVKAPIFVWKFLSPLNLRVTGIENISIFLNVSEHLNISPFFL